MNDNTTNSRSPRATEDMIADVEVGEAEAQQLRGLLDEVAGLAHEMPEPSEDVRAMLGGAIPLRPRRRTALVAAAVGALAFGGVSAAAAANRLPDPIQEVVADVTAPLPVKAPHPVKPVDPPYDAPGHVKNKPKATKTPKPADTKAPKPVNTVPRKREVPPAPGQIQKLTKPDPKAPGPARPADPGSHGRVHNDDKVNGSDTPKPDKVKVDDDVEADEAEDDNDDGGSGGSGSDKKNKG